MKLSDPFTRRSFVTGAAKAFLGVGAMPMIANLANAAESRGIPLRADAKAKSVIYIYLSGGMSHLDTLDTKPGSETQGPVESIDTSVRRNSDQPVPAQSRKTNPSCGHHQLDELQPGCPRPGPILHAHELLPAWHDPSSGYGRVECLSFGKRNESIPANIKIGGNSSGLGGGFLESNFAAVPVGDPLAGLQYSSLAKGVARANSTAVWHV